METPKAHGQSVIIATLVIAFLLRTVPLPGPLAYAAPEWVALVVIYWVLALPYRLGVFFAFTVGLFADAHEGTPLGMHALCFSLLAFMVMALYQRIRVYPPVQQASTVLVMMLLFLFCKFTLRNLFDMPGEAPLYLIPALTSAALWPWIYLMLRGLRIRYRVK